MQNHSSESNTYWKSFLSQPLAILIPFNTKEIEGYSLTDEEALPSYPLQVATLKSVKEGTEQKGRGG